VRSIDVNPLAPCNHAEPGRKHSNGEQPAITAEFTEPQPADPGQYSSAGSLHSYQPNAPFRAYLVCPPRPDLACSTQPDTSRLTSRTRQTILVTYKIGSHPPPAIGGTFVSTPRYRQPRIAGMLAAPDQADQQDPAVPPGSGRLRCLAVAGARADPADPLGSDRLPVRPADQVRPSDQRDHARLGLVTRFLL